VATGHSSTTGIPRTVAAESPQRLGATRVAWQAWRKLPGDEAEVAAQLEQEVLEVINERPLEVALGHDRAPLDSEEREDVRISALRGRRVGQGSLAGPRREPRRGSRLGRCARRACCPVAAAAPAWTSAPQAVELVKGSPRDVVDPRELEQMRR
jgi:hypothetical protein